MQRDTRKLAGKPAVGVHGHAHVVGLGREHDVTEVAVLEVAHEARGAQGHLLGKRQVVTGVELTVDGASVHADADGDARRTGGVDHGVHLVPRADVARVDAQTRRTQLAGAHGKTVVKVNVGHHGHRAGAAQLREAVEG